MLYSCFFAEAVMFDVLLTAFVLSALHGVLDLDACNWRRGMSVVALAGGLGVLTKGPVALLPISAVLILAPYWSSTARAHRIQWYGASVCALLGSIAIALAWAIPAAKRGGPDYAQAIFLGQTTGRVAHSFAHARAFWWYIAVLPVITLPWSISVRGSFRASMRSAQTRCTRFAVAWFVPSFAAFCLISGKQAHYLFPLMPALALYFAQSLDAGSARIDGRAFAWLLVVAAAFLLAIKQFSTADFEMLRVAQEASPLSALGLAALGLVLLTRKDWQRSVSGVALTSTATASLCMLAATQVYAPRVHVLASAERIRLAQTHDRPIAFIGLHHGLFELAGRLVEPLEQLSIDELTAWCTAHPAGELVTFYSKYTFATRVAYTQPLAFGSVRFWDASELCAEVGADGDRP
jgi:4-amino-4-deoxy-L-arabinose transferase-like glycosyltransferase